MCKTHKLKLTFKRCVKENLTRGLQLKYRITHINEK